MAAISALLLSALVSSSAPPRFAVIVAANHGGDNDSHLRYAVSDAEQLQATLQDLGGFQTDHVFFLRQPTAGDVSLAFAQVREMVRKSGADAAQSLLFVYYAGNADTTSAHMGNTTVPWQSLMREARKTGAAARVLVLDVCRGAGAATTAKPVGPTVRAEPLGGLAIVASFSPDDRTRESTALGGAVFTHHLLAALRGVGDANGDGKVSLGEAMRYSAERTASSDETSVRGDAPANYRYRLAGHADVMLTQPALVAALSALHLAAPGTYFIRQADDSARGTLTQAVVNASVRTLWLPPGRYAVERRVGRSAFVGDITLAAQSGTMVEEDSLRVR